MFCLLSGTQAVWKVKKLWGLLGDSKLTISVSMSACLLLSQQSVLLTVEPQYSVVGLTLNDWCCARWMLPLCKHYIHEWTRGVPLQCHSQGAAYLLSPLLHLEEHTFNGWSPLLLLWPSPSSSHPCLSAASSSSLSSWITVNWLLSSSTSVRSAAFGPSSPRLP